MSKSAAQKKDDPYFGVRLAVGKAVSFGPNADDEDLLPQDVVAVVAPFGRNLVLHVFVGFQVRYRVIEEKSSGVYQVSQLGVSSLGD
jgi:hypothetical protein